MKGRKLRHRLTALLLAFAMIFTAVAVQPNCDAFAATKVKTPVATHGRLSVKGYQLGCGISLCEQGGVQDSERRLGS